MNPRNDRLAKPIFFRFTFSLVFLLFGGLIEIGWAQVWTFSAVHSFNRADGATPYGGLIADSAGNLYGTASYGGVYDNGVVFKIDPTGHETVLYSFTGLGDGLSPYAGLVRDSAGNLYGTTLSGGDYNCGVVFKLNPAGVLTVLHSFTGKRDGSTPTGALLRDSEGNLYGTTQGGGANLEGVVFKLDSAGTVTVMHAFNDLEGYPVAGLTRGPGGTFYGATAIAGGGVPWGVVFELGRGGIYKVLFSFYGGTEGGSPYGNLIVDAAGNLYGTTMWGGNDSLCITPQHDGCGLVFRLDPAGNETLLYTFKGQRDGGSPPTGVVRDPAGNIYGTTSAGGVKSCSSSGGCGVVFLVTPDGREGVLHTFSGNSDGAWPYGMLLQAQGGLYGTAAGGGDYGWGTVFKISR